MQPFFSISLSWFSHFHWLWVTNPSVIPQWPALSPWKLCLILNYILSLLLVLIYHSSGTAMILHFIYRKFLLACSRKKTHSLSIIRNNHCVFWFLNSLLNLAANYSFKGNIWKYIIYLHTLHIKQGPIWCYERISSSGCSVFIIHQMQYLKLVSGHLKRKNYWVR